MSAHTQNSQDVTRLGHTHASAQKHMHLTMLEEYLEAPEHFLSKLATSQSVLEVRRDVCVVCVCVLTDTHIKEKCVWNRREKV